MITRRRDQDQDRGRGPVEGGSRSFVRDMAGASAAEFVLVLPLLLVFLFGIMQYGLLLFTYNNMQQSAREGARAMAAQDATPAQAQAIAQDFLVVWHTEYSIVAETTAETGTDHVRVTITLPGADAGHFDLLPSPDMLVAQVSMRKE